MRMNMLVERRRRGLTIKTLAEMLKVHPNAVSRWENGKAEPTAGNLIALCELYECSPEYLLDMVDERDGTAVAR